MSSGMFCPTVRIPLSLACQQYLNSISCCLSQSVATARIRVVLVCATATNLIQHLKIDIQLL